MKSLAEVVAYAKANPGKISWGTQGFGTSPHLLLELFNLEAGIHILHVPYRGTAPMLTAAVAGEVQMVGDPMTSSLPHIQSGKLRPLAIPGSERSSKLPMYRPRQRPVIRSCLRHSGSAWSRQPARQRLSSTSSTLRSAKAFPRRRRVRALPRLAQKSRAAPRRISAICSPRNSRCGPAS